jgi:hypothetical protein
VLFHKGTETYFRAVHEILHWDLQSLFSL